MDILDTNNQSSFPHLESPLVSVIPLTSEQQSYNLIGICSSASDGKVCYAKNYKQPFAHLCWEQELAHYTNAPHYWSENKKQSRKLRIHTLKFLHHFFEIENHDEGMSLVKSLYHDSLSHGALESLKRLTQLLCHSTQSITLQMELSQKEQRKLMLVISLMGREHAQEGRQSA